MSKQVRQRRIESSSSKFSNHIPQTLQRVLIARDIQSEAELQYPLAALLTPDSLLGFQDAVGLLAEAIEAEHKIMIVGDFDADGATSTSLGILALRAMGAINPVYLVPNRFEYGYGLTPEIVEVAKQQSPDLLITVDNGIASIEGVAAAKKAGIKVIVTDHHLPGDELPNADAIVNPNQRGCGFASTAMAGVGVIFYVMSGLRAELKRRHWFVNQHIPEPKMADYLDLVALGTVADVVPLDHNNRILIKHGLQRIQAGQARAGILALIAIGGRELTQMKATDLGFVVGPRLNAAGRLDDMSLGIECLLTENAQQAKRLAQELDQLNRERKTIEAEMREQAEQALATIITTSNLPNGMCFYDATWHQGVIGILAARMKDKCFRPVIAFAQVKAGELKGSARSIPGLHIRDALDMLAKRYPHLLSKFGGHAMAAGMTIKEADYIPFSHAFDEVVTALISDDDLQDYLLTDGELQAQDFSLSFADMIRQSGPWGQHFPEPVFEGEFDVIQQRIVGEKHLKLLLREPHEGMLLDAIAFFIDLAIWPNKAEKAKVVFKLDINEFRGQKNLQLLVDYIEVVA